jgi:Zinc-ribbon containing domain
MKPRLLIFALFCALAFFVVPHAKAQEEGSIKQAMSPEEFHKAGLDKLSDEELANLDRWLRGDREKTAKSAAATAKAAAEKSSRTKMDLVVSRVAGRFAGLTGRTVIQLEDGTVWKQANSDDHYGGSPVDHPGAAVIHSFIGYKMRIEGVPEFYVNPVRK